ncbi:MAG: hypothetical protein Q7S33_04750 [Nanoarchaeota archaeon]|nr:hypothetical protein [Nanoarchaeota archaeon]
MVTSDGFTESIRESFEKADEELRKRSRPKEELIIPVEFSVERALTLTYNNSITPMSEMLIGGVSPHYNAGASARLELDVKSLDSNSVKKIIYNGFANIQAGDFIRAYIEKYNVEEEQFGFGPIANGRVCRPEHYVERDFNETESVRRIEKLDSTLEKSLAEYQIK